MTPARQKKILILVLVAGAILVAVDQLLLAPDSSSSPATPAIASAASALPKPPPPPPSSSGKQSNGVSLPASGSNTASFGSRNLQPRLIAATRPFAGIASSPRDIFFIPRSPDLDEKEHQPATRPITPTVDPAVEFLASHHLKAIIVSQGKSIALINDRMLRLGEGIDGFELFAFEANSVLLRRGSQRVRLRISDAQQFQGSSSLPPLNR